MNSSSKLPDPKLLAQALAKTSMSLEEKKHILESLPFLPPEKISALYSQLLTLIKAQQDFAQKAAREELKFQMELKKIIEKKAKEKGFEKFSLNSHPAQIEKTLDERS